MGTSLENDMMCLLESLYFLNEDKNQQIQALEHLAEMCLQDQGDIIFRRIDGLSIVSKIPFSEKCVSSTVVQKALITLGNAVLQCDENKNIMCTDQILEIIHSKMLTEEQDKKMIASIAYFLSCLCSNYGKAQNKMRRSKCLEKFVLLYRYYHPKENSEGSLVEKWFDKASSNSPIILNHISHALKAMMNKPRNGDNQIACSRLLNLALSSLHVLSWSYGAKIEALQFIADCLYENGKTLNIFNMIGGVRLLSQLLGKQLTECRMENKEWLMYLSSILDTIHVIVSDHGLSDEVMSKSGFIDSLLLCLQNVQLESLHLKCLMCLSQIVYENELCQKKLATLNGVADVITHMSKKQDDITSKVGTSILQSCVKTLAEVDGLEIEHKGKEERKKSIETSANDKSDKLKQLIETLKSVNDSVDLQNVLKAFGTGSSSCFTGEQKTSKPNLRRGKRLPPSDMENHKSSSNDKNDNNTSNDGQGKGVIIDMLKSQHKLLQKFQDEISCLRAEVKSQPPSNYGDTWSKSMTPMRSSLYNCRRRTPRKTLHPNVCPGTEPRKRLKMSSGMSMTYMPQPSYKRAYLTSRLNGQGRPFGTKYRHIINNRKSTIDSSVRVAREEQFDMHDDDERPALVESEDTYAISEPHDELDAGLTSKDKGDSTKPLIYRVPSVYEKVTKWQQATFNERHEIDQDGFKIPIFTPSQRGHKISKKPALFSRRSMIPRPVNHQNYKTPIMEKKTESQTIRNAPKKPESTKRRRPTSPDEGSLEEPQTPGGSTMNDQNIRRSLNFERLASFEGDYTNNGKIKQRKRYSGQYSSSSGFHEASSKHDGTTATLVYEDFPRKQALEMRQTSKDVCLGCKPMIRQLNSRNFFAVLQKNESTCDFHLDLCYKIKEKLSVFTKETKRDTYRTPAKKKLYIMPKKLEMTPNHKKGSVVVLSKKKLSYGNCKDVETMSVFSFRSNNTFSKEEDVQTVCSASTKRTNASGRRPRQDYLEEEINYIFDGVERYGRRWNMILNSYPFKDGRQAVDISDKYRQLRGKKRPRFQMTTKIPVPFTTEELVNLKLGVFDHGEKWHNILREYSFDHTRTPHQLKDKWETLMKQPCTG